MSEYYLGLVFVRCFVRMLSEFGYFCEYVFIELIY